MARNPYLKQHLSFCDWLDRERESMTPELIEAAETFKWKLWCAANNPKPPPGFKNDLAKFMAARNRAVQN